MKFNQIVATGLLALFGLSTLAAQETTATLVGNISDSTGAVAPNVSVQATNLATNTSRKALTDGAGNYSIPFLPAGDYTVTVSHPGFQTQKAERFTLQIQQTARLDFKLTVGNVSESVEVSASALRSFKPKTPPSAR